MLAYVGSKLTYVGFMLAFVGIMLAHAGIMLCQVGSCWLKLAPCWPTDAQNGSPEPPGPSKMSQDDPKIVKNGSQDEVKIVIFEVSLRKSRKSIWNYYSNVFSMFWR